MKTIAEVCEYDEEKIITATDGCGVPVHALPLKKFAQGFARLSKPEVLGEKRAKVVKRLTEAMTTYPEMVAGTDRFCTDLMKVCGDRLFAKAGAAGYYAIGLKGKGIGMTFKSEDAAKGIVNAMVLETLRQLNIITPEEFKSLDKYYTLQVTNNRDEIVGHTEIEFELI
jgi:L-asparaginase II